ncbi:MAG: sugar phosphate isomerase/epimerase [Microcella sp.]|uniref:sugar phosphate isomerase/epimerase family protein n=1 Tax=Microcella sp. TaxID=1913979 RepID=UPI0024CD465B|nr:sugar phosphate isomerase/epimerase family protein [Microcella sp.]UYN83456.1 MAG: sugar phosphate isomerase/epimerase [Microcella sp.]
MMDAPSPVLPERIAVATLGFDGFGDEAFEPAFSGLPDTGFRSVEFNCWYARTITPQGLASIRDRSAAICVTPVSLHVPSFSPGPEPSDLARETARWCWLIEAATIVGVTLLKCTGRDRGEAGGVESIIALLREVAPVAAERGVRISLENHANNVLEFAEDYDRIFDAIDDPGVGMCLDTGHFAASGVDMLAIVDRFGSRINHVDLKDCAGPGREFVPFGDGVVDFDEVLDAVNATGYSGYLVVEFPRRGDDTALTDLAAGAAIARRHVDEVDRA